MQNFTALTQTWLKVANFTRFARAREIILQIRYATEVKVFSLVRSTARSNHKEKAEAT